MRVRYVQPYWKLSHGCHHNADWRKEYTIWESRWYDKQFMGSKTPNFDTKGKFTAKSEIMNNFLKKLDMQKNQQWAYHLNMVATPNRFMT